MAKSLLSLAALLLLPALVLSAFPWPDNVTQHKGYIEVNKTHGVHLFYWFFESRGDPSTDPLVMWLTGGPGCSSELALFQENGPFLLKEGETTPKLNPYGWNKFANLLYVDQPADTGFSYITNPLGYVTTNERQIATELWDFLRQFYALYPKYSHLDLFIVGESYAGHYVPATGQVIVESNSVYAKNLKGVGIGNGWVDPVIQYGQYGPFALANNLISESTAKDVAAAYDVCKGLLDIGVWPVAFIECQLIMTAVMEAAQIKLNRSMNPYDIRLPCKVPPLCYDMSSVTKFLNRPDVQADLGVNKTWEACTRSVELFLLGDWVKDFHGAVGTILSHGRRVDVYSGKEDFICNYFGGNQWTNATQWSGAATFDKAQFKKWSVDGQEAGMVKSGAGLTFVEVNSAGHMVPMDQPAAALSILSHLVHNNPYTDY